MTEEEHNVLVQLSQLGLQKLAELASEALKSCAPDSVSDPANRVERTMMTDLSTLSHDELADHGLAFIAEIHARADALDDGLLKDRTRRLAKVIHGAMDAMKSEAVGAGLIQPLSGGDPKPV